MGTHITISVVETLEDGVSLITCGRCQGAGYHKPRFPHHCEICGGKGVLVMRHESPLVRCGRCAGLGHTTDKFPHHCEVCSGSGAVAVLGSAKIVRS